MPEDESTNNSIKDPNISDVLDQLQALENKVDSRDEKKKVRKTIRMVEKMSISETIEKYTTRDVAQTFVGGILLSLPLLVEDGVFDIAEWFAETTVAGVPVFLVANIVFVLALSYGLIYWADIRQVKMKKLLGIFPRRLVAVLIISFFTATFLVFMWGRHAEGGPTEVEAFGRITVIWAAAAFGGALGDILPGESRGEDINQMLEGMLSGEEGGGDGQQNAENGG